MRRQHEVLFEELKRRGFGWVFTKPNNNSYLYLKKLLGFSDVGELRAYAFPIRPFRALGRRLGFLDYPWLALLLLSGWLAHPLRPFKDVSLDELHPDTGKATCIQRERNAEFLRNRYGSERYHAVALNDRYLIFSTNAYGRPLSLFRARSAPHGIARLARLYHLYRSAIIPRPMWCCALQAGTKAVAAADPHSATVPAEQIPYRGEDHRGSRVAFRCRISDGLCPISRWSERIQGRVEFRA